MSESLPRGRKGAREAGGDGDGAAGEACGRDETRCECDGLKRTAVGKKRRYEPPEKKKKVLRGPLV